MCARVQIEREGERERDRERYSEAGRLGTGRLGSLVYLGCSISFRALSTPEYMYIALLISCRCSPVFCRRVSYAQR